MSLKKPTKKQLAKTLNRQNLPVLYRKVQQADKALELYCRDLLLQCKTPDQTVHALMEVYADEVYVDLLVTQELQKLNNKKDLFEELVKRGLGMALEQKNLRAYFTGLALLKDLYGVHKSVVTTIKEDRPKYMSSAFLDLKSTDIEPVEVVFADDIKKD